MNRRHSLLLIVVCWAGVAVLSDLTSSVRAADDPINQRINQILDQRVSLELADTTLKQAASLISQCHEIEIEIDLESLKEIEINENSKATYSAGGVTLKEALQGMLAKYHVDLTYEVNDGKLRFVAKK